MLLKYSIVLLGFLCNFCFLHGEEVLETCYNINGKYPLNRISDKFLSISIDPAVLVAGLNLSDTSLLLAQHLSPAYIRIAGPSTKFVKYVDNEDKSDDSLPKDANNLIVTPSMWFAINEWLKLANLTPVFGINDVEATGGAWEPKLTMPLLEISDKLNVSCRWMLGFDSTKKTETQYVQDLNNFKQVLDRFPTKAASWKVVGSDISRFSEDEVRNVLDNLNDAVTAVMWETIPDGQFENEESDLKIISSKSKPSMNIWTVSSTSSQSISFSSALKWANQVGKIAKMGFEVVFRQPRLQEIFVDSPVYWFSLLHKRLMGTIVLEAESVTDISGSSLYVHCTRPTEFEEKASLTIMIVNTNSQTFKAKVGIEKMSPKYTEIHSYILTSLNENSTDTYLNGIQLTPRFLQQKDSMQPEISIAKAKPYLSVSVPPRSIGFFVLPKTRLSACLDEDYDSNLRNEESEEPVVTLQSRGSFTRNSALEDLRKKVKNEMQLDERFSKTDIGLQLEALKKSMQLQSSEEEPEMTEKQKRQMELAKKRTEMKKTILDKARQTTLHKQKPVESRFNNIELTSEEAERVLKERARTRAVKHNIRLNEEELDIIVEAVKRYMNSRYKRSILPFNSCSDERSVRKIRDVNTKLMNIRSKLEENRQRMEERKSDIVGNVHNLRKNLKDKIRQLKHQNYRYKRDINIDLLKLKTEGERNLAKNGGKSYFKHRDEKKATIRQQGQTSDELLNDSVEEDEESYEKPARKIEVYAEIAEPTELEEEESGEIFNSNKPPKKKLNLFRKRTDQTNQFPFLKPHSNVPKLKRRKSKNEPPELDDPITFLTGSDEFSDIEEDLPCIHEYFGPYNKKEEEKNKLGLIQKQLKKKGKKVDVLESTTLDSMEYLRKRRSRQGDIPEIGEIDLPEPETILKDEDEATSHIPRQVKDDEHPNSSKIHKRDTKEIIKQKASDKQFGKIDIKQRFKDLQLAAEKKKLKLEEDFAKNKLKLSMSGNRKDQNDDTLLEKGKLKTEKKKEVYEKLQLIKEKIKNKKFLKKNGDNTVKVSSTEEANGQNQEIKQRMAPTEEISNQKANKRSNSVTVQREKTSHPADIDTVVKRSLLDQGCNLFGDYRPLTRNLKAWKPSDILSLKRDSNSLHFPKLKPANDFQMFSNAITPYKYLHFRRKRRSLENNLENLDSNAYLNEIEKYSVFEAPEVNKLEYDVKILPQELDKEVDQDKTEILSEKFVHEQMKEAFIPNKTAIIMNGNGKDSLNEQVTGNVEVKNITIHPSIMEKYISNKEQSVFDNFVSKISEFFTNIGTTFQYYIKKIT